MYNFIMHIRLVLAKLEVPSIKQRAEWCGCGIECKICDKLITAHLVKEMTPIVVVVVIVIIGVTFSVSLSLSWSESKVCVSNLDTFLMFFMLYILCGFSIEKGFALTNLRSWSISRNSEWMLDLHWFSYDHWKYICVDSLNEHTCPSNCVDCWVHNTQ